MDKQDIVTVVTMVGEFVGKFVDESVNHITLGEPRLITPTERGIGFLPTVCVTGTPELSTLKLRQESVCFVVPTHPEVAKEYRSAVSGLVLV